ncbi:MAG: pyridoxal-phosphate dependent enzyme [Aureliella sp.]
MNDFEPSTLDIAAAHARIAAYIHRTPVFTSSTLDRMTGAKLFFKCENLQKIGAFKARGAHNAVLSLSSEERARGVVTHSSGNHAAALALAACNAGTVAHVVMPVNAPKPKVASVERLGGRITFCEATLAARESAAAAVQAETGATFVHPYDDWRVIAGQATAALELIEDVPELDAIVAPVGGGGLLSGTALVAAGSGLQVYGAEPAGADDAFRSLASGSLQPLGKVDTIADGLRTSLGVRPFEVIKRSVRSIATVSDEEIIEAMLLAWQVMKIVIEPSSAVPLAALLKHRLPVEGRRVGVILSGGNVDLLALPWLEKD